MVSNGVVILLNSAEWCRTVLKGYRERVHFTFSVSPSETGAVTITRAKYGRVDENTCTDSPSKMTFCLSPKAFTEVVGMWVLL